MNINDKIIIPKSGVFGPLTQRAVVKIGIIALSFLVLLALVFGAYFYGRLSTMSLFLSPFNINLNAHSVKMNDISEQDAWLKGYKIYAALLPEDRYDQICLVLFLIPSNKQQNDVSTKTGLFVLKGFNGTTVKPIEINILPGSDSCILFDIGQRTLLKKDFNLRQLEISSDKK